MWICTNRDQPKRWLKTWNEKKKNIQFCQLEGNTSIYNEEGKRDRVKITNEMVFTKWDKYKYAETFPATFLLHVVVFVLIINLCPHLFEACHFSCFWIPPDYTNVSMPLFLFIPFFAIIDMGPINSSTPAFKFFMLCVLSYICARVMML